MATMLAGCVEQTDYRLVAMTEEGQCSAKTVGGGIYDRRQDLEESYYGLIEASYLLLRHQAEIYFTPEQGGNYPGSDWEDPQPPSAGSENLKPLYIGESRTALAVSNQIQAVEIDYACPAFGREVPRLYWLSSGQSILAALSLYSWQEDQVDGDEHQGRIVVFYRLEGSSHDDDLVFLYDDHLSLYEEDIGGQEGSDMKWREAEAQAIQRWLQSQ